MNRVRLAEFDNSWYRPGRSPLARARWFFVGLPLLECKWNPFSEFRVWLLRLFGARIGQGVVIKPGVRVKYPWLLTIGNYTWLGEDAWIDNLGEVTIGADVCVSQNSYLCTGNHDWSDPHFRLIVKSIVLNDCCWVGAGSVIAPGITVGEGAVATAGSVVYRDMEPWCIYSGNPATFKSRRRVRTGTAIGRCGENGIVQRSDA
jgi:putative colanic acid biosynthesis acetyltransferase WcaF